MVVVFTEDRNGWKGVRINSGVLGMLSLIPFKIRALWFAQGPSSGHRTWRYLGISPPTEVNFDVSSKRYILEHSSQGSS